MPESYKVKYEKEKAKSEELVMDFMRRTKEHGNEVAQLERRITKLEGIEEGLRDALAIYIREHDRL